LCQLVSAIKEGRTLDHIPNLTWKDENGVHVNNLIHVPSDIDAISLDYRQIMRSTARHHDLLGHLPFLSWLTYPIVVGLSCRGCVHNCVTCGGSASAYRQICKRAAPAMRDPAQLARDIGLIARYIKAPSFTLGDILQRDPGYAQIFLDEIAKQKIENEIALEFFAPPPGDLLERAAWAIPNFNIQISPESHDETVRRAFGRNYDNVSLERSISDALSLGCKRVDVFFMIGLPRQTPASVRETIDYCETLLQRFERLIPFISPLAPFVDPGSRVFEDPAKHG